MNINKQKGFTLVEIAIVLVIIGLLLGGILKGQELINSARVRNLADQNSGIQAAYYGFIDRFRQVPGDWAVLPAEQAMGDTTVNVGGNGNGRIDNTTEEAAAAWAQLAKSNFLGGGFTPAAADATTLALYGAAAPVNAFNGTLVLSRNQGYTGTRAERLNLHMGANVPVSIARELDVKVDDGLPNTGVLRLTQDDGNETDFDDAVYFTESFDVCSALAATNAAGTTSGTGVGVTDIYDIYSDEQDCGQVFVY